MKDGENKSLLRARCSLIWDVGPVPGCGRCGPTFELAHYPRNGVLDLRCSLLSMSARVLPRRILKGALEHRYLFWKGVGKDTGFANQN